MTRISHGYQSTSLFPRRKADAARYNQHAAGAQKRLTHVEPPSIICQRQGKRNLPVHVKDFGLGVHGWHKLFLDGVAGLGGVHLQ